MHSSISKKVRTTDVEYVCGRECGPPPHIYRRRQPRQHKNIISGLLACVFVSLFTLVTFRSLLFPNTHLVPVPLSNATPDTVILSPCQTLATPTATPDLSTLENLYDATVEWYCQLLQQKQYEDAYKVLSTDLHRNLSFSQFTHDANYLVLEKQWFLYKIVASEPITGRQSWVIEALLKATVSSIPKSIWYNWEIFLSMQEGHPAITSITLHEVAEGELPEAYRQRGGARI